MTVENREIADRINTLILGCRNLVIASLLGEDQPLSSQAPFARDDRENFLVLVSGLAEHGQSLNSSSTVNIMLMEDESGLANPFARERLNYNCTVDELQRGSAERAEGEKLLIARFGKFVETLISLPDFTMYRLSPVDGRYVAGFGAAYAIANGGITPLGGK